VGRGRPTITAVRDRAGVPDGLADFIVPETFSRKREPQRPTLQLFRIESERLKLSAPFSRRIAEPLDADAAGLGELRQQSLLRAGNDRRFIELCEMRGRTLGYEPPPFVDIEFYRTFASHF
jgi:hypothetical protein